MLKRKLTDFFKKYPCLLLAVLVLLTSLVVYCKYVFGPYEFMFRDIGSDTAEQYYMQFCSIVNHIRNGNLSLWDFTNGFGTSMYQLNLFNPSLWLIYLTGIIFGPHAMSGMLIYVHILVLILAGCMAWKFLSCFNLSVPAKLIAAYIYSFNGYLTIWGQHYQFSVMLVFLPLLLCLVERSMQKRKFSPAVCICTMFMLLCSYYLSYMILIVCAFYVILRLFQTRRDGIAAYIKAVLKQGLALLLGVFMGILNLLPSYALVFSISSRMDTQDGLLTRCLMALRPWTAAGYYKTLFSRMLSGTILGIGNESSIYTGYGNLYEAPCMFFSSLFLILLVQFALAIFFRKNTDKRTRIVQLLALLGSLFSVCIMLGSLVFNAFSLPFCRHTFLLMPLFALMTAYMLDLILEEHFFNRPAALITAFVCMMCYLNGTKLSTTTTQKADCTFLWITLVIMTIALFGLAGGKAAEKRKKLLLLLCLAVGMNVACDTYSTVGVRVNVSKNSVEENNLYGEDWNDLTSWLKENDSSFYRIEKDYTSFSCCMDSLGQYYRGISTYNSTENRYILEFVEKVLPEMRYINSAHLSYRQIADQTDYNKLFGIKYVVSLLSTKPSEDYTLVKQFGSLYLYQYNNWTSFATFYSRTVSAYDFENKTDIINTGAFLNDYLLLDDEEPETEITDTSAVFGGYTLTETDSLTVSPDLVPDEQGLYSWQQVETFFPFNRAVTDEDGEIVVKFKLSVNGSYDLQVRSVEELEDYKTVTVTNGEPVEVTLQLPAGSKGLYIHNWKADLITTVSDFHFYQESVGTGNTAADNASITMTDTGNDSQLSCQADLKEAGYILFPVPYENGWTVTVNGQEQETIRADYGFTAVKLDAGSYNIELNYTQPLVKQSLMIMAGAWGIFLVLVLLHLALKKKQIRS